MEMAQEQGGGDGQLARVVSAVRTAMDEHKARERKPNAPFLTLTYAQSVDGSIAAERGVPTLLSGPMSMKMTHALRGLHDGILVGVGTIVADNPSLNTRLVQGSNPKPIVVDSSLRCPTSIKLFTSPASVKPIILFVNSPDNAELQQRRDALEAHGATLIACEGAKDDSGRLHVNLRDAFRRVLALGITSVMVEGGASILTSCLRESSRAHLMDLAVVTIAPTFIGGLAAVSGLASSSPLLRLERPRYVTLGDDLVLLGRFPSSST